MPWPSLGAHHVEQQPGPQRGLGHEHGLGLRLEQQLAVDEQRGHERLDLGQRQAVALDELLVVEGGRLLAEGEEALARDDRRAARPGLLAEHLVGGEARVAAEGDEVASPRAAGISRRMSSTMFWMCRRNRRTRCSWLPCQDARFWRMRIAPSA